MIKELVDSVKGFHEAADIPCHEVPYLPDKKSRQLRQDLLTEEFNEYLWAEKNDNVVGIADGLADIIYVAVGTAIRYGIDIDAVIKEVCRSNDSKVVGGKVVRRDDGKILKPDTYSKPNIEKALWPTV